MSINWINIVIGALVGGLVGFFLVRISDWSREVRLSFKGTEKTEVNFGYLYKLCFTLTGYFDPGICSIEILAKDYSTFAKWDEKPNPLKRDNINEFIPELVPATFYQNLFLKRKYKVPVVVKDAENKYFVFDGWWFGKKDGYYHGKELSHSDEINVIIRGGNGLKWKQIFSLKNITSNNSRVFSKRPKICKIINKF